MEHRIREMTPEDLDAVYDIECASFFTPWSKKSILHEIENNKLSGFFVLTEVSTPEVSTPEVSTPEVSTKTGAEEILGYYCVWHILEESNLNRIAIKPDRRGEGLSALLMEHFMEETRKNRSLNLFLEVRVSNAPAIALYRRFGFETIATRKNYYSDTHEDAYVMSASQEAPLNQETGRLNLKQLDLIVDGDLAVGHREKEPADQNDPASTQLERENS